MYCKIAGSKSLLKIFAEDKKKWIVQAYGRNISPTKVQSDFFQHYQIPKGRIRVQYKLTQFLRVNQRFEKTSSVSPTAPRQRSKKIVEEVSNLLEEDSNLTIRKATPQLSLSNMTLWRILRYDIKAKFYHPTTVQPLTAFHIQQRLEFSNWFLAQEEGFEQRLVWTDETLFV